MTHTIILEQEIDGRISVHCPELPGCHSWGETEEEAIQNIKEAITGYLEVVTERIERAKKSLKVLEVNV